MKKQFMLLLTLILSISACTPAFIAGAAVGSAIVYDQRGIKTIKDDHAITYRVAKHIQENEAVYNDSRIQASSFNRVVLLVGQAKTSEAKNMAENFVLDQPEIKRVYNQITVGKTHSIINVSKDTVIAGMVKAKMIATDELRSGQIKVVAEDATIYLLGDVSRRQAELATRVARGTKGVKKVVRLFEIAQP